MLSGLLERLIKHAQSRFHKNIVPKADQVFQMRISGSTRLERCWYTYVLQELFCFGLILLTYGDNEAAFLSP